MEHIIRSAIPFTGLIIIGLAICIAFPQISVWLPTIRCVTTLVLVRGRKNIVGSPRKTTTEDGGEPT